MEEESLTVVSKGVQYILETCTEEEIDTDEIKRNVKSLTDNGHGEDLYNVVKDIICEHLKSVKSNILTMVDMKNFLEVFCDSWYTYDMSMFLVRETLIYMESLYKVNKDLVTLRKLGTVLFRDIVFNCVADHIRDSLLDMIMAERKGEKVQRYVIKISLGMLVALGIGSMSVYEELFENPFLLQAEEYYNNLRLTLLKENDAEEYVKKIDSHINEELDRAADCLDDSTLPKLRIVLKKDFSSFFLSRGQYHH